MDKSIPRGRLNEEINNTISEISKLQQHYGVNIKLEIVEKLNAHEFMITFTATTDFGPVRVKTKKQNFKWKQYGREISEARFTTISIEMLKA